MSLSQQKWIVPAKLAPLGDSITSSLDVDKMRWHSYGSEGNLRSQMGTIGPTDVDFQVEERQLHMMASLWMLTK